MTDMKRGIQNLQGSGIVGDSVFYAPAGMWTTPRTTLSVSGLELENGLACNRNILPAHNFHSLGHKSILHRHSKPARFNIQPQRLGIHFHPVEIVCAGAVRGNARRNQTFDLSQL